MRFKGALTSRFLEVLLAAILDLGDREDTLEPIILLRSLRVFSGKKYEGDNVLLQNWDLLRAKKFKTHSQNRILAPLKGSLQNFTGEPLFFV